MITLLTKDGRKTGNAIIYDVEETPAGYFFLIETDFGNLIKLTREEVDELFWLGRREAFGAWQKDRDDKQLRPCQKGPGHSGVHSPDPRHYDAAEGRCMAPTKP